VSSAVLFAALVVLLATGLVIYRAALGIAILAFAYPFDLTTRVGFVKLTTSSALLAIAFVVWAIRQCLRNPPELQRTPLDWPVALFAGATVLSLVSLLGFGADADAQLVGLLKAAGGFLVFFLTAQSLRERRDLWLVLGAILATSVIQAVAAIIPIVSGVEHVSVSTRPSGTTTDANLFAGYLLLIIPMAIALAVATRRRTTIAAALAATTVYGAALVATLSRSGLLGLLAGTVTLVALLPEKRKRIGVISGALIVASFAAGLVGPFADRLAGTEAQMTTLAGRLPIWGAAFQIFTQHFVFGAGVGNFGHAIWDLRLSHAHNLLLNIAAERGILGLAAFCLVIAALFQTLARSFRNSRGGMYRILTAGLIASFIAFFVHSLVDASYYDYKILLLFWILVGVAATLPRLTSSEGTT
jgi:O-antigen ligase